MVDFIKLNISDFIKWFYEEQQMIRINKDMLKLRPECSKKDIVDYAMNGKIIHVDRSSADRENLLKFYHTYTLVKNSKKLSRNTAVFLPNINFLLEDIVSCYDLWYFTDNNSLFVVDDKSVYVCTKLR